MSMSQYASSADYWKARAEKAEDALTAQGWQPIATAPKDGTWILLAGGMCDDESDNQERIASGQWTNYRNNATDEKYGRWQFSWNDGGCAGEYEYPTHWMPLPTAPKEPA
jgi:hypothetical protein